MPDTASEFKSTIQLLLSDQDSLSKAALPAFLSRAELIAEAVEHGGSIDDIPLNQLKILLLRDVDSLPEEKLPASLQKARALVGTNEKGEEFPLPEGVHRHDQYGIRYWYHDSSVILENGAWELFDDHGTRIGYPDKRYYNSDMRVTDLQLAIAGLVESLKKDEAIYETVVAEARQFERELIPTEAWLVRTDVASASGFWLSARKPSANGHGVTLLGASTRVLQQVAAIRPTIVAKLLCRNPTLR